MPDKKVLIIGLDCAEPDLVFNKWLSDLPNIRSLMENGVYGRLESVIPPITVPAWASMTTGKDPGELGFYGFRNRKDYSYDGLTFANSTSIKEDTVWDVLSKAGKKAILVGVPQTYPPKPINGNMVTCFLTPSTQSQYTYPPELKKEIEEHIGGYIIDVHDFRTEDKGKILQNIYDMTENHFKIIRHLITKKEWDFFMFVEMGIDRIQHGFWSCFDENHIKFKSDSPFADAIKKYYMYVDREIGKTLELIDENTTVMVVSDHGAKKMDGGICVNEWLIKEGYLRLSEYPGEVTPFSKLKVDWGRTKVWSEGGYYARIFMNVKGREPLGIIEPSMYENVRDELVLKLSAITDESGKNIGTRVFKPQEIYAKCNGIPPDLIVHFGNLDWRSVGSVGSGKIHVYENDTGPDDANHAQHGIFIMNGPDIGKNGVRLEDLHIMDIAPTILDVLGEDMPLDMKGKVIS